MSEPEFPKRRSDGSFTVVARFTTVDRAVLALLRDYVNAWVSANRVWTRIWRSDSIEQERLAFDSEFLSEPLVEQEPAGSSVAIVLEASPSASRWKDWAVFLVSDISSVFPELKFEGFESR